VTFLARHKITNGNAGLHEICKWVTGNLDASHFEDLSISRTSQLARVIELCTWIQARAGYVDPRGKDSWSVVSLDAITQTGSERISVNPLERKEEFHPPAVA
jgi:hypothetical protein